MRITSARDLGRYVRDRRQARGWSQVELATRARVSRRWVLDLEGGKGTAQVALVFRTLEALGIVLDAQRGDNSDETVDLDQLLRGFTADRNGAP